MAERNNTTMPVHRTYSLMHAHLAERLNALIDMTSLVADDPSLKDTETMKRGMAELVQYARGYTKAMMHIGYLESHLTKSYNRAFDYYCADPAGASKAEDSFNSPPPEDIPGIVSDMAPLIVPDAGQDAIDDSVLLTQMLVSLFAMAEKNITAQKIFIEMFKGMYGHRSANMPEDNKGKTDA